MIKPVLFNRALLHSKQGNSLFCGAVLKNRSANWGLWAKSSPRPVFVNQVLLDMPVLCIYLHIIYGCFSTLRAGSSCRWDLTGLKAKNIYYLALHRKSLLTLIYCTAWHLASLILTHKCQYSPKSNYENQNFIPHIGNSPSSPTPYQWWGVNLWFQKHWTIKNLKWLSLERTWRSGKDRESKYAFFPPRGLETLINLSK